jgi:hypothetical protein
VWQKLLRKAVTQKGLFASGDDGDGGGDYDYGKNRCSCTYVFYIGSTDVT